MKALLSILLFITPVYGIDFEKKESYYIKLCSSRKTTQTCKQFNQYLINKNKVLKENIKKQQKNLIQTKSTLEEIQKKQDEINKSLDDKENEIKYMESSITQLQNDLNSKRSNLGLYLYSLQSYYNYNPPIKNTTLSQAYCIKEIIDYKKDYVQELENTTHQLDIQKKALENIKENILTEKSALETLENEYIDKLILAQNNLDQQSYQQSRIDIALGYFSSQSSVSPSSIQASGTISKVALSKLGSRYWWGKTGPQYFDCSGFVYWTFNNAGHKIPRLTAKEYANYGKSVSSPLPGDLVTFKFGSQVSHIGIYIGNNQFIHASGKGSSTHGQDSNQCVKVSQLSNFYLNHVYNYRRI